LFEQLGGKPTRRSGSAWHRALAAADPELGLPVPDARHWRMRDPDAAAVPRAMGCSSLARPSISVQMHAAGKEGLAA